MPSIKKVENNLNPEYLEQIKNIKSKIEVWIDTFKQATLQTIEKTFWIKPKLEDPRISEAAKQI